MMDLDEFIFWAEKLAQRLRREEAALKYKSKGSR